MNQILGIAKRELRAYFLSPVALIFLATFLFVVLFAFFWVETFFRRNIADARPLFEWLPVLLIFLSAALTMRLWSDEQRSGTLEVLLTLPVQTHRLVLGKFLAGLVLVAVALFLTLGLPISVSMLGELDWGPVFGGYLGALLLAGAYLAIGLCISSATGNAVVALLLTTVACGLLYLIGSPAVTSFASNPAAELLASLGAGSRFRSIQRGVIDLRDLLYYGSLTLGFLTLNVALLESKRWSAGAETRGRRQALMVAVVLVVANLLLLNLNLASVRGARVDLTARHEYSVSPVTKKLLRHLDAPLLLRGYFSKKTHPLLAPLVPKIRDLLEEYAVVGGRRVRVEMIDPQEKPALEKEANEDYGIKSMPFQFEDRHQQAVVNSYFNILIKLGDKYEKLGFEDLIEARVTGMRKFEVKLRNLEYDLTRTIMKLSQGFQPLEDVFARSPGKVELTAYVSPKTLPDNYKKVPGLLAKVAKELGARSGGKLVYKSVDPTGNDALQRELYEKHGFRPMAVSLLSRDYFYLHILVKVGKRVERIFPSGGMSAAELKKDVTAALKRLVPGFLKTVALFAEREAPPPRNPMMMRRPPPPRDRLRLLKAKLTETYTVRDVDLKDGRVPGDIDVLLVVGAHPKIDEKQRYAIDQYLLRGGAVIVVAGRYAMQLGGRSGLAIKSVDSALFSLLESWGVRVEKKMVLDPQNEAFPVPVEREVMGMRMQQIQLLDYPYWVDVRPGAMAKDAPVVAGLPSVTVQWASPLAITKQEGVQSKVLLSSSKGSWESDKTDVQPDFKRFPDKGFGAPKDAKFAAHPLAVLATGRFTSAFKGKGSPLFPPEQPKGGAPASAPTAAERKKRGASRSIERAPASARLAVIGSSELVHDEVLSISRQSGGERFLNNLRLIQNLVDWGVADVALLTIRSRGTYARTLRPMQESERSSWEGINYAIVVLALGLLVALTWFRRRSVVPLPLPAGRAASPQDGETRGEG